MIEISEDVSLCLHPDQVAEIVTVARQTGPAYQRTTLSPVKGMLRRRPVAGPAQPFYRTVCPGCGAWAVGLYWSPVIGPKLINTKNEWPARATRSAEKELT